MTRLEPDPTCWYTCAWVEAPPRRRGERTEAHVSCTVAVTWGSRHRPARRLKIPGRGLPPPRILGKSPLSLRLGSRFGLSQCWSPPRCMCCACRGTRRGRAKEVGAGASDGSRPVAAGGCPPPQVVGAVPRIPSPPLAHLSKTHGRPSSAPWVPNVTSGVTPPGRLLGTYVPGIGAGATP